MADLLIEDRWVLFLVFVVPGFVAMKTHDLLVPVATRDWSKVLVEVVSYSMLNLALLFPLLHFLNSGAFSSRRPLLYGLGMVFILAVFPSGLAIAARFLREVRWLRRFILHPSPTGWDFFFTRRQVGWVLLHFKDGKKMGGYFGEQSLASAYPSPQDIYLEQVWRVDGDGKFRDKVPQTAGTVVRFEECSAIEFFEIDSGHEQPQTVVPLPTATHENRRTGISAGSSESPRDTPASAGRKRDGASTPGTQPE